VRTTSTIVTQSLLLSGIQALLVGLDRFWKSHIAQ